MNWIVTQLSSSVELWIAWAVSVALASGIQGIAQYFSLMILVPPAKFKKEPLPHPFQFVDPFALPIFILTGWGWSKPYRPSEDPLADNRFYKLLYHLAAPIGNLALASIISTLYTTILPSSVFRLAMTINCYVAAANLVIPLPPFSLGRGLFIVFGLSLPKTMEWIIKAGVTLGAIWAFSTNSVIFPYDSLYALGNGILHLLIH
jgi:hypothetical protein